MRLLNLVRTSIPIAFVPILFGAAPVAYAESPVSGDDPLVCPKTITGGIYIAGCLPSVNPPASTVDIRGPNQVPLLYGIPCTGTNFGKCIGLSRLPSATVSD